MTVDILKGYYI